MASKNTYKKRITPGVYFEDKNVNELGKGVNNDKYNKTRNLIESGYLVDEFFGDIILSEDNKIFERETPIEMFGTTVTTTIPVTTTTTTLAPTTTTTTIPVVSDVDLIRQLRDANPGLAELFSDSLNPYTQWWAGWGNGALFGSSPTVITYHANGWLIGVSPETPLIPDKCYVLELTRYQPLNGYNNIISQLTELASLMPS